ERAMQAGPAVQVGLAGGAAGEVLAKGDVLRHRGGGQAGESRRVEEQLLDPLVRRAVVHGGHRSRPPVEVRVGSVAPSPTSSIGPRRARSWAIARRVRDFTVPS